MKAKEQIINEYLVSVFSFDRTEIGHASVFASSHVGAATNAKAIHGDSFIPGSVGLLRRDVSEKTRGWHLDC